MVNTRDQKRKKVYWYSELNSLGIETKRDNEISDTKELRDLTDNIKQTYYQDYKTAYDKKSQDIGDSKSLDYIV